MAASRSSRARLRWVLAIGAVLVAIALAATWFATRPTSAEQAFEVVTVARSDQVDTVALSGTIVPEHQANAAFTVPGTISAIRVKVGDTVGKGAPLASLETRDLRDAVAVADANAATARAQLDTVRDTSGATSAQIEAARAGVRSADAAARSARNRLSSATLTSPIAGTVAQVGYSVGDQVAGTSAAAGPGVSGLSGLGGVALPASSTTAAIVVIATDAWRLDASVGTVDLAALKHGQKATVTPTGTADAVEGTVDTVGIVATQAAGAAATFPVTITITRSGVPLYSGSSADAVVVTGTYSTVLSIPDAAVTTANGVSTVELAVGAVPELRAVTLGRRFGAEVEVTAGLVEGDQIRVPKGRVVKTSAPPWAVTPSPSATQSA